EVLFVVAEGFCAVTAEIQVSIQSHNYLPFSHKSELLSPPGASKQPTPDRELGADDCVSLSLFLALGRPLRVHPEHLPVMSIGIVKTPAIHEAVVLWVHGSPAAVRQRLVDELIHFGAA